MSAALDVGDPAYQVSTVVPLVGVDGNRRPFADALDLAHRHVHVNARSCGRRVAGKVDVRVQRRDYGTVYLRARADTLPA